MITAQDIREKTFEKARIGGYDMAEVDDFLEELAEDITSTQKENAVLKSKMKVLVDKIEEYRSNEEALNLAVLSAQKLAVQIENDARARAAAMLSDAEAQVKTKLGTIPEQVAAQQDMLAAATASTSSFIKKIRQICAAQLTNLDEIDRGVLPAAESSSRNVDETVRSIERSVPGSIKAEPKFEMDLSDEIDPPQTAATYNFNNTQPFSL